MEAVLIFVYPVKSHFIALFGLANTLSKHNYRIVFVGKGSNIKNYVEMQGFEYYGLETFPFAMNFERFNGAKGIAGYFANIYQRSTDHIFNARRKELENLIKVIKPSVILIDQKVNSDFIVLFPFVLNRNIKVIFIQTMLNTYRTEGNIPINYSYYPSSKFQRNLLWKRFYLKTKAKRLWEAMLYWGWDNESMKLRKITEQNMPLIIGKNYSNLFQFCFKSIPEFILSPEELEFETECGEPNQYYIGPMLYLDRREIAVDNNFNFDFFREQKNKNKDLKIIYCSFGTMYGNNIKEHQKFVCKLVEISKAREQYIFVVSFQKNLIQHTDDAPSNLFLFDFVDQLKLLQMADLFISSAGIKSIKESIYFETPMLVYPWNAHDHYSNSAKVETLGFGLKGNLRKDRVVDIINKIDYILDNRSFKDRITKLKNDTLKYNDETFFTIFSRLPVLEDILVRNSRRAEESAITQDIFASD